MRLMLNSEGRYVPYKESDLFMDKVRYGRWWISLYERLPERIRDDEDPSGKRLPALNEMKKALTDVYTERELGESTRYRVLPERVKRKRRQVFFDNHFKIPKNYSGKRKDELEVIKSKVLKTDNYDELQEILTDFMNKRYIDRQIPNIYRKAHKLARKMVGGTVHDDEGFERMNSELEYRKPVPLTLFSQEELTSLVCEAEGPSGEEPKASIKYTLNSEGGYVPKGESDLLMGEMGYTELMRSVLDEFKAKTRRPPGGKGITPTGVLRAMAGCLLEETGFWHGLPHEAKVRKIERLCAEQGLDPSGISGREGFIRAFVESRKALWAGKTNKGNRDFRRVYAIRNDMIRRREKGKEPGQEAIDRINEDLMFPEQYQIPMF